MGAVMGGAEGDQVLRIRATAVGPVLDVVDLHEPPPTARHPTPPVAVLHMAPQRGRHAATRPPHPDGPPTVVVLDLHRRVTTHQARQLRIQDGTLMETGGAGRLVDVQDHQRRRQRHVTVVVAGEGVFGHADQGVAHRRERPVTAVGGDEAVVVVAQGAVHHRPPVGVQTGGEAPGAVLVEAHRHRLPLGPPLRLGLLGGRLEVGVGAAHPGQLGDRHRWRRTRGLRRRRRRGRGGRWRRPDRRRAHRAATPRPSPAAPRPVQRRRRPPPPARPHSPTASPASGPRTGPRSRPGRAARRPARRARRAARSGGRPARRRVPRCPAPGPCPRPALL